MRPSMRQVAERAQVSQVTVTNVLRGRGDRASTETRERVLQAVRELGYVPVGQWASQQRHVATKVIGVVFDQIDLGQTYAAMHAYLGLREGALRHGYDLLMVLRPQPDWAGDREELQFLDRRCDGYVFVAPLGRHRVFEALVESRIPVVACYSPDVPDGVGWATSDNEAIMRQAVGYLRERGHQKIAHWVNPGWSLDVQQRADYFLALAHQARQGHLVKSFGSAVPDGAAPGPAELRALMDWGATAVICSHDGDAVHFWDLAAQAGVQVPRDISLLGVDDSPVAAPRGLTAIRVDGQAIARVAVDCWKALEQGGNFREQRINLPGQLVERMSVAPL